MKTLHIFRTIFLVLFCLSLTNKLNAQRDKVPIKNSSSKEAIIKSEKTSIEDQKDNNNLSNSSSSLNAVEFSIPEIKTATSQVENSSEPITPLVETAVSAVNNLSEPITPLVETAVSAVNNSSEPITPLVKTKISETSKDNIQK